MPRVEEIEEPLPEPYEAHALESELRHALEDVGPAQYARVTAREFAKGGKYNPTMRPVRFAKS